MEYGNFLSSLNNHAVKDLFWSVASESPLSYDYNEVPIFPLLVQEQIVETHLEWFLELDSKPELLEDYLERKQHHRLGFYFESLLQYFFENSPFIQLELSGYQIIEDKRTVGEIDFIFTFDNITYHIEVAIKFYLQNGNSVDQMLGPNAKDRLSLKLDKVKNHQLPIVKNKQIKDIVKKKCESYLFLKGQFYTNEIVLPKFFNPRSKVGKYMKMSNFKENFNLNDHQWYQLVKPNWISSTEIPGVGKAIVKSDLERIEEEVVKQKKAARLEQLSEYYFIVSDQWPTLP